MIHGSVVADDRHVLRDRTPLAPHQRLRRLRWEARFPGEHATIKVDGAPRKARTKAVNGKTSTCTTVSEAPGRTATVTVS
ncbi:hypothetical protein [Streptomyces sp. NPDC085466]|uniref:hypothetical protein n=1 Tax=Streptomyces sp. NPDC085466 TaxID=3365725 RepID=UPI0037D3F938